MSLIFFVYTKNSPSSSFIKILDTFIMKLKPPFQLHETTKLFQLPNVPSVSDPKWP